MHQENIINVSHGNFFLNLNRGHEFLLELCWLVTKFTNKQESETHPSGLHSFKMNTISALIVSLKTFEKKNLFEGLNTKNNFLSIFLQISISHLNF